MFKQAMDLIKTIDSDEEIEHESDSSNGDGDDDLRAPKSKKQKSAAKSKTKTSDHFDDSFVFVSNQKEYMKDTWSDLSAYIRKKAKTTLTDKIAKIRKERVPL